MLALLSQVGAQVVNGDRSELRHDSIMLTPVSIMQAPASSLTTFVARCPDRAANFAHLAGAGMHYVGSLPPSSFPDLLAVPARPRRPGWTRELTPPRRCRHALRRVAATEQLPRPARRPGPPQAPRRPPQVP